MKLGLIGLGKMGSLVATLAKARGHQVISFDKASVLTPDPDLFIDFSIASAVLPRLKEAVLLNKPMVIGTTGWEEQLSDAKKLVEHAKMAVLYAPNFSLGVLCYMQLLKQACSLLSEYDRAGIETHHKEKKDTPSGTAKLISEQLMIPFSSVRLGHANARIEVQFDSPLDTITLTHQAKSHESFAQGALDVAEWLISQTGWKTLHDYLHSTHHTL